MEWKTERFVISKALIVMTPNAKHTSNAQKEFILMYTSE
jgi:hypothetical protein